ncbi:DNA topoisomerase 2-alpha-like isoform X1 [Schistocerca nitens]|uniref:DNA topoisomerase 2-alpha-like isoform X1 n=2 Tax=Schistocerca nitens TaxID=7011 RepID=UPI002118BBF7|nr:DNA topoisomerase 2-alpha-like isoform X1 [Schistocerca nitens]
MSGPLVDCFSKMNAAANEMQNGSADMAGGDAPPAPKKNVKNLTVEKIYQKKSQLEHVLLRPDTYIGSVEPVTEVMWVYDSEQEMMVQKEITYVPGLYKIFDEILVNAADNKQRDPKMDCIKIDIDAENNTVSVWNNGKGIPVVEHKDEKMYVPTMIFGYLLTSSNYNDEEEKVTGGRNGYGAKLCNIFSTKFTVETASKEYKRAFKQTWANNMSKTSEPKIKDFTGEDYTKVIFSPDLAKFKMEALDKDIVALMSRRAYDVAASTRGVKVMLNGKRLPVKNFKDYVELYIKNKDDETGNPLKIVYEQVNDRWEVALTISDKGFQQVSFVNSIATTKGGRHVDHVSDMIVKQLIETLKKKNKNGIQIKPFQVKNHMWLFVNCLIVNPTFDSQTKENMTLQAKSFGSKCPLSEKFINSVTKSGIVESILMWAKAKADTLLTKACSKKKQSRLTGIPKLEDANHAGTQHSLDCTLILTEGDSAKSLAVSGLGVIGRDKYGVFPLRGKLLNVREASHKQIMDNAEINNIIRIVGLQYKKKYESVNDLKTLRYGKLMIMTDQDQDGSHIKGLLINFIHHNWPSLLQLPFLEEFITPIVKASKGSQEFSFYSLPEFEEWKASRDNWHTYKIKYYKGLGTSTSKEAKEYFMDMKRHRIKFKYGGPSDDHCINMAFSKKCVEQRKEWLTAWMEDSKRRKEMGLPEQYLYEKDTQSVNYSDFVNKELVLFSNCDNERSIPSLVDGFKPGQRKVLFTCLKRNDKREVKVAQLAGSVAEHSAYHHGEQSLMSTIVNLAQNFVGSNNINVLQPIGQFGTRLNGGKDSASPRYIFTMLSPLTRYIFHKHDDALLKHNTDDNQRIEPVWYIPIIPMVLVNGADGIGTGWMTKIPNYNPREIIENLRRMIEGEDPKPMIPWYKNYRGVIEPLGDSRYVVYGEVAILGEDKLEITELPIGVWTQTYKENVLEPMMGGSNDKSPPQIVHFQEYNTDTTVRFVVKMTPEKLQKAEQEGLHKFFKLETTLTTTSMCAFDDMQCLRKYDSVLQILKEFFNLRLNFYGKRKAYLEGMLQAESLKLSNQARFILEKCDGVLVVENKKKKVIIEELKTRGYDADPVRQWKLKQDKDALLEENSNEDDSSDGTEEDIDKMYDYLLGMTMWTLTKERKDELLAKRDEKLQEYKVLQSKSPSDLWKEDLHVLLEELDKVEAKEKAEAEVGVVGKPAKGKKAAGSAKLGGGGHAKPDTMPAPHGRRIEPKIDPDRIRKMEKADAVKENKGKRGKKKKDDDAPENGVDGRSLQDRVGCSPEVLEKKLQEKRKDNLKQTKLSFKGKGKGSPKKKKDPWESDSEDSEASAYSEDEFSPKNVSAPTVQRTTARRSAAAKVKFTYSDSEEEESEEELELHDNKLVQESEAVPQVDPELNTADDTFTAEKTIDVSDTDSEFEVEAKKKAAKPKKKKVVAKESDSDSPSAGQPQKQRTSDDMFDSLMQSGSTDKPSAEQMELSHSDDDKKKKKKGPAKKKDTTQKAPKQPRPAKKKKKSLSGSDSEDMFEPKKKKSKQKDSDDDFEPEVEVQAPKVTTGRARKPVKYSYNDDDDDDDDSDF